MALVRYFAYGSNLLSGQMRTRCPGHRTSGPAQLPEHRLAFTRRSRNWGGGVADILPAEGKTVWGLVYELTEADVERLDKHEGHPTLYRRVPVAVTLADGQEVRAETYVVVKKAARETRPSAAYLNTIVDGAREHGLPDEYVGFLEGLRADDSRWWGKE